MKPLIEQQNKKAREMSQLLANRVNQTQALIKGAQVQGERARRLVKC